MEDIEVKNAGKYGIDPYQSNHSLFQNIYAHDNYRHGIHPGTNIMGRNQYNTYNNIEAWNNGAQGFDDWSSVASENNTYNNINCWDNGEHGIAISNQIGSVLSNSSVSGNGVDGIYLKDLKDFSVNSCSVTFSGVKGILITGASNNINLTNVIVKNNNTGIAVYGCIDIALTDCQSYDDRDTPLQEYGLELTDANTNISLVNCKLTPNKNGEIYNPAGAVVTVITEKN